MIFRKLLFAASAIALSACASTPGIAQVSAPNEAEATASSGPALWRLSDDDTTIYLFGTVHFLPEGVEWYNPTIRGALESADEFVSEIDTSAIPEVVPGEAPSPELMAIMQTQMRLATLETGGTVRDLMTDENRAEYEAALARVGVPAAALDGFEPWMGMMTLTQLGLVQVGIDPSTGVERVLDSLVEGKERAAFETVEQQFGFFDSLPMEAQLAGLDQTVEMMATPEALRENFDAMVTEWMEGDAAGLATLVNDELAADPALYATLLSDRNARWAEWLDERMDRPGTVFVAVGAGHLGGAGSVQYFLHERGLTAERVAY
ncbi:TraB/GumN family protein [Aurantiacibacter luteus]|uniref:Polysaccharide biosynthesis protein GumN n=1 Tax=Aurantiacibacter luteus TaxID=1581420 RepID=A0A0G9MXS6_9SPHN|nr:TraB/GumN family protein [Aurantiacibacter luteus]KLE35500.1 hypothetical protein AAW00_03485 [Aurantiacibacter luteus]